MDALEGYGFKDRKDGSKVYRDDSLAVVIYPAKEERYGIGIHQRRWGGTYWVPLTATSPDAAAIFAMDWLADPNHIST